MTRYSIMALSMIAVYITLITEVISCNTHTTTTATDSTAVTADTVGIESERSAGTGKPQYESFLLYSKAGQDLQIKNTPGVKNPEKNWYQIRSNYWVKNRATQKSQLDTIRDGVDDGFSFVTTGKPTFAEIKAEYPSVYNTPTVPPSIPFGWYLTADTAKWHYDVNVLIDSLTNIYTPKCKQWGFFISKNTMRDPRDPNHFQSVQTQKVGTATN